MLKVKQLKIASKLELNNKCGKVKSEGEGKNETLLEIGGVSAVRPATQLLCIASVRLLEKAGIIKRKQMCDCAKAITVAYSAPILLAKCGIEGRI